MGNVLTVQMGNPAHQNIDLHGMFSLRDQVFRQRLKWSVKSHKGLEQDEFDQHEPTYMIAQANNASVEGCWRLLSTTGPYMLRDTFPQLLRGEQAPCDGNVWEISRFAVMPHSVDADDQTLFRNMTLDILRSGYEFAIDNDITHYVAVMGVAMERFLGRVIGVPMRRFGDRRAQHVGKVRSVACWIDVDERLYKALYQRQKAAMPQQLLN